MYNEDSAAALVYRYGDLEAVEDFIAIGKVSFVATSLSVSCS